MRILMLTQSYPPIVGGEERAVEDLSLELAERGHDVAVATLRQPGGEPRRAAGIRVHAMGSSVYRLRHLYGDPERRHAPPAPDPETVLELGRVLRRERPDVVHAHNWLVHSYLPLDRAGGPALGLTLHDYGLLCATKRLMRGDSRCSGPGLTKCVRCAAAHYGTGVGVATALATRVGRRRLGRHVDLFLTVSRAVGELSGLERDERWRVVPNLFRPASLSAASGDARHERLPREPFVLFLGDAGYDKGAGLLASAYADLEQPPPLVFLGRPLLDGLAGGPGVTVLGPGPHALVIEALRRCLFVVVPSIWAEPFGLVALEAAAAGKPVIASDTGGLRDIVVDGETGLLVTAGDRRALRVALSRLIGDADLRARMAAAAVDRAAGFGPAAVVPRVEAAYREAIERRRARRSGGSR